MSLLAESDYNQITIEQIAADAEVSRQTFYYNFSDKADLWSEIIAASFHAGIQLNREEAAIALEDDMRGTLLCAILSAFDAYQAICIEAVDAFSQKSIGLGALKQAIYEELRSLLRDLSPSMLKKSQANIELAAMIVFGAAQIMAVYLKEKDIHFAKSAVEAIVRGLESGEWLLRVSSRPLGDSC